MLFDLIAPIFFLVLAGFLLGRYKLVPLDVSGKLIIYIFYAAAPAVVFVSITQFHLSQLFAWKFWLAYLSSIIVTMLIAYVIFKFVLRRNNVIATMAALNASFANTIMIGFPILAVFDPLRAAIPMAITAVIFNCIVVPPMMLFFEYVQNQGKEAKVLKQSIKNTLKNPIVLAAIFGLLVSLLHIHIPVFIEKTGQYFGGSLVPCALFAVGLDLNNFSMQGKHADISLVVLLNLIARPFIAIGIAFTFHLSAFFAIALVIFSSVPTAKSMYIYAGKFQVCAKETASIISLTTIGALATIPLFIYICHLLWPTAFAGVSL